MPPRIATRTYLELRAADDLRPGRAPSSPPSLAREHGFGASDYRALYALVGERWLWRDRLAWSDAELEAYLRSPAVAVWVARDGAEIAGYFELRALPGAVTEIVYFGLAPAFIGRGLGGWLLTRAVELAFAGGAQRISLNTCTLDSPRALPNYLARGFRIVREEEYEVESDKG